MSRWRSLLFVPGDRSDRLEKAHTRGADALIIDLEDAVAPEAKDIARAAYAAAAARLTALGCDVIARINVPWLAAIQDLQTVVHSGTRAIMVPKVESSQRLAVLAEILGDLERERGLTGAPIAIVALVESPMGLASAEAIASAPRVSALAFGSEDFAAELAVAPTPDLLDLPVRRVILAAAACGRAAFAVPFSIAAFRDSEGTRAAAVRAHSLGSAGGLCIHPDQVAIMNECFRADPAEIAWARRTLAAWASERGNGEGVITLDGTMVDQPVITRARRILEQVAD